MNTKEYKSHLRKQIRTQRKNLSSEQVQIASQTIFQKIIQQPEFLNANHIAYYIADENEIDPAQIIQHAKILNKNTYLPMISEKNKLNFYLIDSNTQFIKNKFNILEPIINNIAPISPDQLDLILLPLIAFDYDCNRLGRGAGFYDRTLQFLKNNPRNQRPFLIGLAYEFQKVEKLIPEDWDVRMDLIITEGDDRCSDSDHTAN